MIRITKMSGKFYGIELPINSDDAMDEIDEFVQQGTPVIIVENLEDLEKLGLKVEIIIMVERD